MAASPLSTGPADPTVDPAASYALDPALTRRLAARVPTAEGQQRAMHRPTAPFTGQPLADVPVCTADDVAAAVERARAAQPGWAAVPASERQRMLLRLHDLVLDHRDGLMDLVQWESGKARKHAYDEVAHIALTARYYGRRTARLLSQRRALGVFPGMTSVTVRQVPKGVVGIVSPWNYPLVMAMCDGIAAIAAGNAVAVKPDQQSSLTALRGAELLVEAGLPDDLWHVLPGEGPVAGAALVDSCDHICFTGSTATGRLVAERAGRRLIGCSLELGGKNPMLVLADADVDRAAAGAVRACFDSAGQLCVSMERLLVADAVHDAFVERFLRRVEAMRLSAALDFGGDMGSLVSERQLATVRTHVADAVAQGATVLTGGRERPDVGPLFFEPTVLAGVTPSMACYAEETFGPVVSLYRVASDEEALARANEGCYGLNASIWSRDTARARALAARLRCGSVNINDAYGATFGSIDAPMGGMRDSGQGRRQGPDGLLRFCDPQTVAVQRMLPTYGPARVSDRAWAAALTGAMRGLRRVGRP